eukprot:TRINITY_DN8067_c0_g1_i1.p1 TRINITY_DN8067_c0_g1~~TRINITY_DN8067_c0_g1_i1.p1  ORF type:complete len:489 (-),score=94.65 TRINITY_DN8067_c0_g1_i1:40-1506(-)
MIMEEEIIQNGRYLRVIFHPAFTNNLEQELASSPTKRGIFIRRKSVHQQNNNNDARNNGSSALTVAGAKAVISSNLVSVVIPLDLRCLETFMLVIKMGRGFWKYGDWIGLYKSDVPPDCEDPEKLLDQYDQDCLDRYYPVTANIASSSQDKGCIYWRAMFAPESSTQAYQFRYFRQDAQLPVFVTNSFYAMDRVKQVYEIGSSSLSMQFSIFTMELGVSRFRPPVKFLLPPNPGVSMLNHMFKLGFEFADTFSPQKGDWIGLFEQKDQDSFYGDRWYEVSQTSIRRGFLYWEDIRSPWKPGSYEFRYFHGLDETLVARHQFEIPASMFIPVIPKQQQSIHIYASTNSIFGKDYRVMVEWKNAECMIGDSIVLKRRGAEMAIVGKKLNEQRKRQGWIVWEAEFAPQDRGAYHFVYQRCTGEEISRSETYYVPLRESVLPHFLIGCLDPNSCVSSLIPNISAVVDSNYKSRSSSHLFDRNVISMISDFIW